MKAIVVDYEKSNVIISSAFKKKAFTPGTPEYRKLNEVRRDYPEFSIVVREFKTNTQQDRYKGLTYDYMRWHIMTNDKEHSAVNIKALDAMIGNSKCHSLSKRYPSIKKWFLETYPEIAEFGMNEEQLAKWREKQEKAAQVPASKSDKITELPTNADEDADLPKAANA